MDTTIFLNQNKSSFFFQLTIQFEASITLSPLFSFVHDLFLKECGYEEKGKEYEIHIHTVDTHANTYCCTLSRSWSAVCFFWDISWVSSLENVLLRLSESPTNTPHTHTPTHMHAHSHTLHLVSKPRPTQYFPPSTFCRHLDRLQPCLMFHSSPLILYLPLFLSPPPIPFLNPLFFSVFCLHIITPLLLLYDLSYQCCCQLLLFLPVSSIPLLFFCCCSPLHILLSAET